jgi:hypothetical protein
LNRRRVPVRTAGEQAPEDVSVSVRSYDCTPATGVPFAVPETDTFARCGDVPVTTVPSCPSANVTGIRYQRC